MSKALATFDVLHLARKLTDEADGLSENELHTLSYLSCLLSVFDGRRVSWWGYAFTATQVGSPFSYALRSAIEAGEHAGLLAREDRVLRLTHAGQHEHADLAPLVLNQRRLPYLDAAAATALAMPLPSVSDALSFEPGLRRALRYVRTKALLDETGLSLLETQFEQLADALDDSEESDLMVPSVVWLTYLAQQRPADREAA